jgi:hypothetical protein
MNTLCERMSVFEDTWGRYDLARPTVKGDGMKVRHLAILFPAAAAAQAIAMPAPGNSDGPGSHGR